MAVVRRLCLPHVSGPAAHMLFQVSLPHRFAHQELSPFKNCVIATGGGVPTRAENWGHMQVGPQAGRQAGGAEQAAVLC